MRPLEHDGEVSRKAAGAPTSVVQEGEWDNVRAPIALSGTGVPDLCHCGETSLGLPLIRRVLQAYDSA